MFSINILSAFLAALASFIIGFLMHGPILGKLWMKLANIQPTGQEKMSDMYGKMFYNLVANFVTACALAVVYIIISSSPFANTSSITNGVVASLIAWLGFLVPSTSIEVIWMGKSCKLWIFEAFSSLVAMIAMGLVIGAIK
jgi:hypothetical protein